MSPARSPLRVVRSEQRVQHAGRDATATEELLLTIVPQLAEAEQTVRDLRRHLKEQARMLASERGVAFLREEQIGREFGG